MSQKDASAKSLDRRKFLSTLGAGASSMALSTSCQGDAAPPKPNVVYFFSDTHRWGAMSFTQTPQVQTPHMEALKNRGVSFDHCYVNLPICTPYRALLLTGHWPWQQGLMANHMTLAERVDLPDGAKTRGTLSWAFKSAGYRTSYFGKWHLGGNDARPFGFDHSVIWGGTNNHIKCRYSINGEKWTNWEGESNNTATVDQSLEWLDRTASHPDPFFLMISVNPPHGNMLDAPQDKNDLYPDTDTLPFHPNDEVHDFDKHQGYHAHITDTDDEVGRLVDKLAELGLSENTIFVYTSDHGGMSGIRGIEYGQKRNPEDESSRVPFLIEWPGVIPENVQLDCLFSTIDHFPTIVGLANLNEHTRRRIKDPNIPDKDKYICDWMVGYMQGCPGNDFSPQLRGEEGGPDPDSVFIMHPSNMNNNGSLAQPVFRGVVTKDWMYAVHSEGEYCLYSRKGKYLYPNLVDEPGHDKEKQELQARLQQWIDEAETPYIENWFKHTPEHWMEKWYGKKGNGGNRDTGDRGIFDLQKILAKSIDTSTKI